jgi:hypothetical protein
MNSATALMTSHNAEGKLHDNALMPTLTSVGKQCTEPADYKSKADHPLHGQPARVAFVINAYGALPSLSANAPWQPMITQHM